MQHAAEFAPRSEHKRADIPRPLLQSMFLITAGWIFLVSTVTAVPRDIMPFEWSMPDRLLENTTFDGYDVRSPVPQYDPSAIMLPPDGWTVNFDACGVSSSTINAYEWIIDGDTSGVLRDCRHQHKFPAEGVYRVALLITDAAGDTRRLEQAITVQDWLIVAVGDSYGSGEGNPLIPSTARAEVDFSALFELSADIQSDLQAALDQLPGLEAAQAAAQQVFDDALTTLNQASADLAQVQQDLQDLLIIQSNVESDPLVTAARNNVDSARTNVASKKAAVDAAQRAYDSCSFLNCATRLTALGLAKTALVTAQGTLAVAEGALFAARNTAVVVYSVIASVQNFDALSVAISATNSAINLAQNSYNAAQNAYTSAVDAVQQAATAVASLQGIITSLEQAWEEAQQDALIQYLDHLPVWTATAPSWGTPEPTYRDIVLRGALPGEALRCHRSMLSGQARAALAIEQADPHTSVTLVHLSCSGAKIDTGLTGTHNGPGPSSIVDPLLMPELNSSFTGFPDQTALPGQLEVARDRIQGREIDAIVASIGGNDIGFSDLIIKCVTGQPCHYVADVSLPDDFLAAQQQAIAQTCNPLGYINDLTGLNLPSASFSFTSLCNSIYGAAVNPSFSSGGEAAAAFTESLPRLEDKFEALDTKIGELFPVLESGRVYLTEYLNPTGNDDGGLCGWDPDQSPDQVLNNLPGVTVDEMFWAEDTVVKGLREATRYAAEVHKWNFISQTDIPGETIASLSRSHGYCADDHWVVRIPESLVTQQDHFGSVHPNRAGHDVYRRAIVIQLLADFYPGGLDQLPRPPLSAADGDDDGVPDRDDNCIQHANPLQRDSDGDGFGNRCDPDLNNDNRIDFSDLAELKNLFFSTDENADFNGDSKVDFGDLAIQKDLFFGQPGPSCCNR